MKTIIAILSARAHNEEFDFKRLGMDWLGAMDAPALVSDEGTVVNVQDLFDAALIMSWSGVTHLSQALNMSVEEIIQQFAVSIATVEMEENPPEAE